jgi:aryl-alcohol dehydrogenase-like predicted oxidoreductase
MNSEIKPDNAGMEYLTAPLKLSRIALGTWAIGGWMWGGTDEAAAIGVIHEAVDRGVTLIDTAPAYGFGRSEEIVGKALAEGGRRKRVMVATKVGLDWKDGQPFRDGSKARIRKEVEDSLRRLRTDVIDIYQVHWLDRLAQANYGRRVIHLALRWVLDRQDSMIALWGARRPDQLDPITGLAGWHIDSSAMAEIDRILSETIVDAVGPEFMAPPVQLAA